MSFLYQGWAEAPSGRYSDQEIAPVIRTAVANSTWMQFADRVECSGGQSVYLPSISNLAEPTSSSLNEGRSIPLDKLTISGKSITLTERGRGVQITEKNLNRSPLDLLNLHKEALSEQMTLDMDTVLGSLTSGAGFRGGLLKYAPTGVASYTLTTNGTFGAAALSNPNFYHIRKMRDLAFRTYLMPPRSDGKYVYASSTAGVRGILDDPEFLEINKNGNQETFQKNEVGTIANVRVVEDNHTLRDNRGTNSDVGEGVFIAREAVKYAFLTPPSVRFDSGDHNRFRSIAWVMDWGCGTSTDSVTAGLPRLIHLGST